MDNVLTEASNQWMKRPNDQRFLSLDELHEFTRRRQEDSWTVNTPVNLMRVQVDEVVPGQITVAAFDRTMGQTRAMVPSHWSFGLLSQYAGHAPASYLRRLPADLAAINLQWGLDHEPIRDNALVLGLGKDDSEPMLRSLTSTTYGRIWDEQVVEAVERVNADGRWQIPAASYAGANPKRATTLYASDRDVFIFLVDPDNPVEVDGETLFRGFFTWNSEVGAATFGLTSFLYRYVCDNRMIWGATNVQELKIRHTGGAPDRFAYEGRDFLRRYSDESSAEIVGQIHRAKQFELPPKKKDGTWADWLKDRGFTSGQAKEAVATAEAEEGEARSLWDIIQGVTGSARRIPHTNDRVELETKAGKLMEYVQ